MLNNYKSKDILIIISIFVFITNQSHSKYLFSNFHSLEEEFE